MRILIVLLMALVLTGCTPEVRVVKNPGCGDEGIRYYRPKPYLLITPAGTVTTTTKIGEGGKPESSVSQSSSGSDQIVQIQLQYLPDFSEEYAVNVKPGFGNAVIDIKLQDGWNLTGIDQTLDSNAAENVSAVTGLVGSLAGLAGGGAPAAAMTGEPMAPPENMTTREEKTVQKWQVAATNVPLGYYEAVIGCDPQGNKQMYGWRYLGFMPYGNCPVNVSGGECQSCEMTGVYGLVFESGVMTFKQVARIDHEKNLAPVLMPSGVVEVKQTFGPVAPASVQGAGAASGAGGSGGSDSVSPHSRPAGSTGLNTNPDDTFLLN